MPKCPCCSGNLLRHVRHRGVYWYCSNCRQEMPDLEERMHFTCHHNQRPVILPSRPRLKRSHF